MFLDSCSSTLFGSCSSLVCYSVALDVTHTLGAASNSTHSPTHLFCVSCQPPEAFMLVPFVVACDKHLDFVEACDKHVDLEDAHKT